MLEAVHIVTVKRGDCYAAALDGEVVVAAIKTDDVLSTKLVEQVEAALAGDDAYGPLVDPSGLRDLSEALRTGSALV